MKVLFDTIRKSVIPDWISAYKSGYLSGDTIAGFVVAIMLIPQGMAYAMLAGLPAQVGLYASILPLIVYSLTGTGRTVSVAPVAIDSLLVGMTVMALAAGDPSLKITIAIMLALFVGIIQVLAGSLRLGVVVNFMSQTVVSGFTNAAALLIAVSQLKNLLSIPVGRSNSIIEMLRDYTLHIHQANGITFLIGALALVLLLWSRRGLPGLLKSLPGKPMFKEILLRSMPLIIIVVSIVAVWQGRLNTLYGVQIVGDVPTGLPVWTIPAVHWNMMPDMLPAILTIAFIGFMETYSVGKALAGRRREHIHPNRELLALGGANVASAFSGGFSVAGGLGRSAVNFTAGARTPLSSIITAALIAFVTLFLTPALYYLPRAVLSAIIIFAVSGLIDFGYLKQAWAFNRHDALTFIVTFAVSLAAGVQAGLVSGILLSVVLFMWRTSRPHIAEVGRVNNTEVYRNILRYQTQTCDRVLAMRIDESLYFANAGFLEKEIMSRIADRPLVDTLLLIGSGINTIDSSALNTLENINQALSHSGIRLHFAELKGPVRDKLENSGFTEQIGPDRFHRSTHEAMISFGCAG